jgi:hypothetical protein
MSKINKVITGLQFEDNFNSPILNPLYTLSSTDSLRYSLSEIPGSLVLKHGEESFLVLMDIPEGDFVFEIKNDYIPKNDSDVSGIIVWKTYDDYIQLLEWCDPTKSESVTYPYIRLERKGITYNGYGSNNGVIWDLIGSVKFVDAGKIGLIVDGPMLEDSVPFIVDYIKIYRNTFLDITNLPVGYKVRLTDKWSNIVDNRVVEVNKTGVRFDLFNHLYPFEGKLLIYSDIDELTLETSIMLLSGGDIYYYGDTLEIYRLDGTNEILINQESINELGKLKDGFIHCRCKIFNDTDTTFRNIKIKVLPYGEEYGSQWVTLCVENEDLSKGPKVNELIINEILPYEFQYFYIEVERDNSYALVSIDPFRFTLLVTVD